jgi:hypothetical protein
MSRLLSGLTPEIKPKTKWLRLNQLLGAKVDGDSVVVHQGIAESLAPAP